MSYKGSWVLQRRTGTCFYLLHISGRTQYNAFSITRTFCSQKSPPDKPVAAQEQISAALKNVTKLGKQWGRNSVKTATATVNYWWEKYEEFVGLNEVRDAQSKVTEAEKAFMVARGMVHEAHVSLEALQMRLKEVRDRLDRVSREEAHYLELATLEHKLLQEERRLKTAYENAEEGEREKFALFSAGVRESHEKERARAERTKNWSIVGSVLGAIIGVMGSTYINRVRLQELKSLLLEAQKGPASLQEAIKVQASSHKSQQEELRGLIDTLRLAITNRTDAKRISVPIAAQPAVPPSKPSMSEEAIKEMLLHSQRAQLVVEDIKPQMEQIRQNLGKMMTEFQAVKKSISDRPTEKPFIQMKDAPLLVCETESIIQGLDQTEKRLGSQINKSTLYNTILTYTAFALSLPVLYIIFKAT
ncbi:mitochondrial potassium channel [Neoarius graeffei]|uniref:mitochondrial potassium channel n=1 Tax=Neoarius graeffei TaxID=443677 RepID=UPI00298C5D91|nr:mitochondrial potassium channel [Neoarius graeffei]XP_060766811.1 mitochondrial potassium channel [Neoarius graeffei]